ncbi:hypothetical protein C922_04770 [Plasmodium inui San Antonio 1]|uniref:6-Cys domain-containing protein n=1 Tax=Plasmodium inui San Antonio 1 TaxID=1237626 RepID=W6ZZX4_9APIC|nr:hypothetical protein C922_04770 [Plasmodium inui San Antonio 1]EUD64823.1 hypothetical protein C922_04770 [Plasmodium inui San Antonio 1]
MRNNSCACSDKDDFYKNEKEKNAPTLDGKIVKRIISLFSKLLDECAQVKRKLTNMLEVFLTIGATPRSNLSPRENVADSGAYTFMDEDKIYKNFFYYPYVLSRNGYLTKDEELFSFHCTHSDRVGIINSEGITNGGVILDEWLEGGAHQQDYKSTWDKMRCKMDPFGGDIRGMSPKMSGRRLWNRRALFKQANKDGEGNKQKDDKYKDDNDPKKNPPLLNGYTVFYPREERNKKRRTSRILSLPYIYELMEDPEKGKKLKEEKEKQYEEKKYKENEEKKKRKSINCRILQENDEKQNRSTNKMDSIRGDDEILGGKDGASSKKYRQFRILLEQNHASYSCAMGKGAEGRKNQRVSDVCRRNSRQLGIVREEYISPDNGSSDINGDDGDGIINHDGTDTEGRQFRILAGSPEDDDEERLEVDGPDPSGSGGSGTQGDQSSGNNGGSGSNGRRLRNLADDDEERLEVDGPDPSGNENQGDQSSGNNGGSGSNGRRLRNLAGSLEYDDDDENSEEDEPDRNRSRSGGSTHYNGTASNSRRRRSLSEEGPPHDDDLKIVVGSEGGNGGTGHGQGNNPDIKGGNDDNNCSECRMFRLLSEKVSLRGDRNDDEDGGESGGSVGNGSWLNIRCFRILGDDDPICYDDFVLARERIGTGLGQGSGNQGAHSSGNNNGTASNGRKFRILAGSTEDGEDLEVDGPHEDESGGSGGGGSGNKRNKTHGKCDGQESASGKLSLLSEGDEPNEIINGSDESESRGGKCGGQDRCDKRGKRNDGNSAAHRNGVLLSSASSSATHGMQKNELEYNKKGKEKEKEKERSWTYPTGPVEIMTSGGSTKEGKAGSETKKGAEDGGPNGNVGMLPPFKKHEIDEEEEEEEAAEDEEKDEQEDDEEEEEEKLKRKETHKSNYYSYDINGTTESVNEDANGESGSPPDTMMMNLKRLIKGNSCEWGHPLKSSSLANFRNYGKCAGYSSEAASSNYAVTPKYAATPNYTATPSHVNYKQLFRESAHICRNGNYYFINPSPFSIVQMKQQQGERPHKGSRHYMDCYTTWLSSKYNSTQGSEYVHRRIKQIEELIPGSLTGFKNDDGYEKLLLPSFVPEDTFLHCIFRNEWHHGMVNAEGPMSATELSYPVKIFLKRNLNKTKGCSFQVKEGNEHYKEYAERESFLTKKIILNETNRTRNECVIHAFNEIVGFQCGPPYRMDKKEKHTQDDYNLTSEKKENNLINQGVSEGDFFRTDPPYCFEHVNENQNVVDILPDSFPFPNSKMLAGQIQVNHTRYIKVENFTESKTIGCYCHYYRENRIMYSGKIIIIVQPSQHPHLTSKGGHVRQSHGKVNSAQGVDKKKSVAIEDMNLLQEKSSSYRREHYNIGNGRGSSCGSGRGCAYGGVKEGSASTHYGVDNTRSNFISNVNFKHKEGINSIFFKENMGASTVSYDLIRRFGDKFKGEYIEELPPEDAYGGEGSLGAGDYTNLDGESGTHEYDDSYSDPYTDDYADPYGDPYEDAYTDEYDDAHTDEHTDEHTHDHTDAYSNLDRDADGNFLSDLDDGLMNENVPSKYKPLDRSVDLQDSVMHSGESQTITVINKSKNVKVLLPKMKAKKKTYRGDREFPYPKVISIVYEEKGNKHEKVDKSLRMFKEFFPPVLREVEARVDALEGEKDIHERGKHELVDEVQDENYVGECIKCEDRKDGKDDKEGRDVTDCKVDKDGKDKIDPKEEKDGKDGEDISDFTYESVSEVQGNKTNNSIDEEISHSVDHPSGMKEKHEGDSLSAEDEQVVMKKGRPDQNDSPCGEQPSQEKRRPRRKGKRGGKKKGANSAKDGKQGNDSSAAEGDKHRGQPSVEKKEHLEGSWDEQDAKRRGEEKADQIEGQSKQMEDLKKGWGPTTEGTNGMNVEIGEEKQSDKGEKEKGDEHKESEVKNAENYEAQERKNRMRKRMRQKLQRKWPRAD